MEALITQFDSLVRYGLQVIPIQSNSKRPIYRDWTSYNPKKARNYVLNDPNVNLGILLGRVIDVEGDTDEANATIDDLIGDYPHPVYKSSRSKHHLFLTPDRRLTHFSFKNIEFRGYGHQSLLPPSRVGSTRYQWLQMTETIPPLPPLLLKFYRQKSKNHHGLLKPGHIEATCSICDEQFYIHNKRFDLELKAFRLIGSKWECRSCRTVDLRQACRYARAKLPDISVLKAITEI